MNRNGNGGDYREEDPGPMGDLPGFGGLSLDDPDDGSATPPESDTERGTGRGTGRDAEQKTEREPQPGVERKAANHERTPAPDSERRFRMQPRPEDPDSPLQKFITQEEKKKRNASGSKGSGPSEDEAIINISPAFLAFVGVTIVVVIAGYFAVNQLIDFSLGGSGAGTGGDQSAEVAESEVAGDGEAQGGEEAQGNPGEGAAEEGGGEPTADAAELLADATGAEAALLEANTTQTGVSYAFSGAAVSPGSSDSEELEISASGDANGDAGEEWSGERAVDTSASQNVVSVTLEGPTIATYAGTISGNEQTLYGSFAQRVSDVTAYASVQSYESTADGEETFSVGGVYNYEEPEDGRISGSFTDTVTGETEDGTQLQRLYTERDAEGNLYRQFAATYELGDNFPVPALVGWEPGAGE